MKIEVNTIGDFCFYCPSFEIETETAFANDDVICMRFFSCKHFQKCKKTEEFIRNEIVKTGTSQIQKQGEMQDE